MTYIVSPHPDDETLRLSGYVTWIRANDPHRLVLVAVGDGGGSKRARRMGWPPDYEKEYRRAEQAAAWSALTGGQGSILRLGMPDGNYAAKEVRDSLAPLVKPDAHFVLAAHPDDYHSDHLACVEGLRRLSAGGKMFARSPLSPGRHDDVRFDPPSQYLPSAEVAAEFYRGFGHISVPPEFKALKASHYSSRVTV
ncbi:PIG-L deacetylase family protein [Serinicoccus kebangsaanensis]|uniref:PIG-L deacetylase family protein n=1 Tax=Serinicoccus kebangsaanensis TaxID=2602069 RepID=UPI00178C5CFA|nr:PIG-L family deacetylase [Serinicoccus kebangsaanensis]